MLRGRDSVDGLTVAIFRMGLEPKSNAWHRFWPMYDDMATGFRRIGINATLAKDPEEIPRESDVVILTLDDYKQNSHILDRLPAGLAIRVDLPYDVFGVPGFHASISRDDIEALQRIGPRIRFVWHNCSAPSTFAFFADHSLPYEYWPMATNAERFKPLYPSEQAEWDVVFVGGGAHRPVERSMLATVLHELGPDRVQVFGGGWESLGIPQHHVTYGAQVNDLYNRARICVNLHTPEQKLGPFWFVNNRVFDIASSGRKQVCDYPEGVNQHFRETEITAVSDERWAQSVLDAVNLSDAALDEAAAISRAAVLQRHTWERRAVEFVEALDRNAR